MAQATLAAFIWVVVHGTTKSAVELHVVHQACLPTASYWASLATFVKASDQVQKSHYGSLLNASRAV